MKKRVGQAASQSSPNGRESQTTARRCFIAALGASLAALAGVKRVTEKAESSAPRAFPPEVPGKELREADFYKPNKWAG